MKRYALVAMALCLTTAFVACGNDDEEKIDTKTLADVNGSYTGTMSVLGSRQDVTATVSSSTVTFANFPVTPLIALVLQDEEAAAGIAQQLGNFGYNAKFAPVFNDDKTAIELTFTPDPINIAYAPVPTLPDAKATVKVTIAAPEKGSYTYTGGKLSFALSVSKIELTKPMTDEPEEVPLPAITLSFDLIQAAE